MITVSHIDFASSPITDTNGETVTTTATGGSSSVSVVGGEGVFSLDSTGSSQAFISEVIVAGTDPKDTDFIMTLSDYKISVPNITHWLFLIASSGFAEFLLFQKRKDDGTYTLFLYDMPGPSLKAAKSFRIDGIPGYDETVAHDIVLSRASNVYSCSVDGSPLTDITVNTLDGYTTASSYAGGMFVHGIYSDGGTSFIKTIGDIKFETDYTPPTPSTSSGAINKRLFQRGVA